MYRFVEVTPDLIRNLSSEIPEKDKVRQMAYARNLDLADQC